MSNVLYVLLGLFSGCSFCGFEARFYCIVLCQFKSCVAVLFISQDLLWFFFYLLYRYLFFVFTWLDLIQVVFIYLELSLGVCFVFI